MGSNYDPTVHSKLKLGQAKIRRVAAIPIIPDMPTEAQIEKNGRSIQFKMDGGMYVTASSGFQGVGPFLMAETPKEAKTLQTAVKHCPVGTSFSGSDTPYFSLTVVPDADGKGGILQAGEQAVCKFVVDPEVTLLSSDEPIGPQIENDTDEDEE